MQAEFSLTAEISCVLTQVVPQLRRAAHKRLVWFVLGILLAQSIVLRKMASAQASRGGGSLIAASHERRLRRLLNDPQLNWAETYAPALRRLVRWNPHQPV